MIKSGLIRLNLFISSIFDGLLNDIPGVTLHTSFKPEFACVIGLFSVEGFTPG